MSDTIPDGAICLFMTLTPKLEFVFQRMRNTQVEIMVRNEAGQQMARQNLITIWNRYA